MKAQTKTQNRRMVLKHGGAPLVGDESGLGRRAECTEVTEVSVVVSSWPQIWRSEIGYLA